MSKLYILPDGKEIDLSKIKSIGTLKSVQSRTFTRLGYWYFTIFYKDGTKEEIQKGYFYSDWSEVKIKLKKSRDEILKALI